MAAGGGWVRRRLWRSETWYRILRIPTSAVLAGQIMFVTSLFTLWGLGRRGLVVEFGCAAFLTRPWEVIRIGPCTSVALGGIPSYLGHTKSMNLATWCFAFSDLFVLTLLVVPSPPPSPLLISVIFSSPNRWQAFSCIDPRDDVYTPPMAR